jgi:hypothetical protein
VPPKPPRRKTKKRGTYGVYAKNHPRSVQWKVDYDYLAQLSPEEKQWLAKFTDEFVGADFRHSDVLHDTVKARRQAYKDNNAAKQDAYSKLDAMGRLVRAGTALKPPAAADTGETPEYLDYPGYKRAVQAYRDLMPTDRRRSMPDTPKTRAARATIERIARMHEDDHGQDPDETPEDE